MISSGSPNIFFCGKFFVSLLLGHLRGRAHLISQCHKANVHFVQVCPAIVLLGEQNRSVYGRGSKRCQSQVRHSRKSDSRDQRLGADLSLLPSSYAYILYLSQSQASKSLAKHILPYCPYAPMKALSDEVTQKEQGGRREYCNL